MTFQSSGGGTSASIVGDLLDYLNESWTQFHATGNPHIAFTLPHIFSLLNFALPNIFCVGFFIVLKKFTFLFCFLLFFCLAWPGFLCLCVLSAAEAKRQLIAAGFHLLNENDEWELKPGGRYFFTRNMSCLVAFAVGEK